MKCNGEKPEERSGKMQLGSSLHPSQMSACVVKPLALAMGFYDALDKRVNAVRRSICRLKSIFFFDAETLACSSEVGGTGAEPP